MFANYANMQTRNTPYRDNPCLIATLPRRLLQQRRAQPDKVEYAANVQIHYLIEGSIGVGVEGLAPGCAGIGYEDVNLAIGRGGEFLHEAFDLGGLGEVGGEGEDGRSRREGLQRLHGLGAGGGFARGYY